MPSARSGPPRALGAALLACSLVGCGARSSLEVDASPTPTPVPALDVPRFDCRVSASTRPMLAARIGTALHYAYPDRSTRQVFSFALAANSYVVQADVLARGDRVAAYVVTAAVAGAAQPPPSAEMVVLDLDGQLVFHERADFAYQGWGADSQLVGNDQGLFVVSLLEVHAQLGRVIDGVVAQPYAQRMAARSDPDAAGRLVAWDADASSSVDFHFFDTAAGTFTPSAYLSGLPSGHIASQPALVASGLLYLRDDPARLVFEDAAGQRDFPSDLPLGALAAPALPTPGSSPTAGHVLFQMGGSTELDARYVVARYGAGAAAPFSLSPPPGFTLPADFWNPPPIDATGRIIVPLLGEQRVQLHATKNGVDWAPLGRPVVASGYPTHTRVVGGTAIFQGNGDSTTLPGALPAWATQLIGPQGGEGIELVRSDPGAPDNPFYADDEISTDGACLAYFRSGSLRVVEVADYSAADLGLSSGTQSAEMSWIPLAK